MKTVIKNADIIIDGERKKFDATFSKQGGKIAVAEQKVKAIEEKYKELADLNTLTNARITALRSQYGLIKENEDFTTMEMADALFGVTMQEKGVSKLVSVKLADVAEFTGESL